jgi:hypothetical protein
MSMPYLHVYIIMFQDAWSTSHTSQVHRKKDDGRQLEAEENQGVEIIGTQKTKGKGINRISYRFSG